MDFYNEDGDSNIDYSNRDDFYAGNVQVSDDKLVQRIFVFL